MIGPHGDAGWEKLVLAGVSSPGKCTLSGQTRAIGWDVKEASGQSGATTTRKGEPIGKFSATFELSDDPANGNDFDDWDAWQGLMLSSVLSDPPVALEVVHPDLYRLGWTSCVLAALGEMVPDGKGGASCKCDFIEYRPPKPKSTTKPAGAKETEGDRRVREAEDEYKRLIEEGNELW